MGKVTKRSRVTRQAPVTADEGAGEHAAALQAVEQAEQILSRARPVLAQRAQQLATRHAEEVRAHTATRDDLEAELAAANDEHASILAGLEKDHAREIATIEKDLRGQIAAAGKDHAAELKALRDAHERATTAASAASQKELSATKAALSKERDDWREKYERLAREVADRRQRMAAASLELADIEGGTLSRAAKSSRRYETDLEEIGGRP